VALEDSSQANRRYPPFYKALAIVAILVLLFGGGWASLGPSGGSEGGADRADMELAILGKELKSASMAEKDEEAAAASVQKLAGAARLAGIDPREAFASAFPDSGDILAMLALDRDIDDFLEYSERNDAAGEYYRDEARRSIAMRPLRSRYDAAFAQAAAALAGSSTAANTAARKKPYIASPRDVWLPARSELPLSHPYALDVFFFHVERSGEAERGPTIRALYPGIVVAAAADWSGGQGVAKWKSGGLSPAAGNGVVIFDPATRRYCSYFHLSSLSLHAGDYVPAGAVVGRGGNSGMNARKKSHGEHVHIEIFDSKKGESLSANEIYDLLRK
jgi:murein DD-endopeptidase MepM/ murein hydrolase activator NlpD